MTKITKYHVKKPKDNKNKVEFKLLIYFAYIIYLISVLLSVRNVWLMLYAHLIIITIFSLYYFGRDFFYILLSPIWIVVYPLQLAKVKYYLKKFSTNTPKETVVVLAHSNWRKLEAWVKPNYFFSEIKLLAKYLKTKGSDFSFYTQAGLDDVNEIMRNDSIKEVYFYGHGSSHVFQLGTDEILYYCEFGNGKYSKDYVHQMHCGTEDGKSLVDYVVPEENKNECFLIRKSITALTIEKVLKKKMKEISKNKSTK